MMKSYWLLFFGRILNTFFKEIIALKSQLLPVVVLLLSPRPSLLQAVISTVFILLLVGVMVGVMVGSVGIISLHYSLWL